MISSFLFLSCAELNFDNDAAIDHDGDGYSEFDGDCDDTNPDRNPIDHDGDGVSSCDDDCDDFDASKNFIDFDGDGVNSCEGDCRDDDPRFQILNCPKMIQIDAGKFFMGSPEDEIGRDFDEERHEVTLTHNFEIMSTEVNQSLYVLLTGENPSLFSECGDFCPVESINWHAAAYAANALSDLDGYEQCYSCQDEGTITCRTNPNISPYECSGYRLPTEAEWEYAARFGSNASFWTPTGGEDLPASASVTNENDLEEEDDVNVCNAEEMILSGNTPLASIAWFCANNLAQNNNQGYGTKQVGQLQPNGYGIYDMHGNVYEWIHDGYAEYPQGSVVDPLGKETVNDAWNNFRVIRGGFWGTHPKNLRSANRVEQSSSITYQYTGFRLARTVD